MALTSAPQLHSISTAKMDDYEPKKLIESRLAEFSKELPSVEEIDAFYTLEKVQMPAHRPYIWSNTIASLDGVVSIGKGNNGVKLVGLKNYPQAQAKTDFRLLAAGWAYADVIVFSAASFRAEPEQQLLIPIADLKRFRRDTLKKPNEQPDIVMVTASGWIDASHPAWKVQQRRKLIATSRAGIATVKRTLLAQLSGGSDNFEPVRQWLEQHQVEIKAFESDQSDTDVDFVAMCHFLKYEWKAQFVDVSAGPTLICLMIKAKVIDECRYTTSGIIAGRHPIGGPGIELPDERPETYPTSINIYPLENSPVLEFVGVRMFGPFHVYHRGRWIYRH